MKLRQAKQLLKIYPPVLKIFVPEGMSAYEKAVLNKKLREEIGDRMVVLIFPNQFKLDLTPFSVSQEKIEEFKKAWVENKGRSSGPIPILDSNSLQIVDSEMAILLEPVQLMSVLDRKTTNLLYTKQLQRIKDLVESFE